MCYQNQMLVALFRASARCYVLAEDLRREVTVPRNGPLRAEGELDGLRVEGARAPRGHGVKRRPEGDRSGPRHGHPPDPDADSSSDSDAQETDRLMRKSRRQMPWVRLCHAAQLSWEQNRQVKLGFARILTQNDWGSSPVFAKPCGPRSTAPLDSCGGCPCARPRYGASLAPACLGFHAGADNREALIGPPSRGTWRCARPCTAGEPSRSLQLP